MPPSATAQAQIDRANKVLNEGSKVTPGCTTCRSLARPCIIYPPGEGKLNKCYQCTLSKQSCSIDRKANSTEYSKQTFDRAESDRAESNSDRAESNSDRAESDSDRADYSEGSPKEADRSLDMLEIARSVIANPDRSTLTPYQAHMKLEQAIAQITNILDSLKEVRDALGHYSV